jgi:hypothetical protein
MERYSLIYIWFFFMVQNTKQLVPQFEARVKDQEAVVKRVVVDQKIVKQREAEIAAAQKGKNQSFLVSNPRA